MYPRSCRTTSSFPRSCSMNTDDMFVVCCMCRCVVDCGHVCPMHPRLFRVRVAGRNHSGPTRQSRLLLHHDRIRARWRGGIGTKPAPCVAWFSGTFSSKLWIQYGVSTLDHKRSLMGPYILKYVSWISGVCFCVQVFGQLPSINLSSRTASPRTQLAITARCCVATGTNWEL